MLFRQPHARFRRHTSSVKLKTFFSTFLGILKNMVDVMAGDNADEIAKEKEAVVAFGELKVKLI